ncbi:hypothetical protein SCHPADRAFT_878411 [Schizopora paradoxa]|uniref:RRM domain-containing protein n=1 Tax=Schizopora paradoxa TaxID=27342 RepID=A0A0H2RL25_9AGAM|nr:hypothetical protein SCHPADRAFT_878411 [Schizopora paradoxa]
MPATSTSSSSSSSSDTEVPSKIESKKRKNVAPDSDNESSSDDSDDSDESSNEHLKASRSSSKKSKTASAGDDSDSEDEEQEDGPVLSHAAKRRQKKRQKLDEDGSTSKDTSEAKDSKAKKSKVRKDEAGKSEDKPKRQNSVWVGNMSFKTTPESLRTFFDGVGEITRVHMPMKAASGGADKQKGKWASTSKENRGFAYVDFGSPDAKILAISFSEKNLDGRRLLIKDGDDFAGRPAPSATTPSADTGEGTSKGPSADLSAHSKTAQKILRAQKQPPGPTLFLGNLGFETSVESITEMITAHHRVKVTKSSGKEKQKDIVDGDGDQADEEVQAEGKTKDMKREAGIRKVRMGTFEDSGLCKGFAFVDFISAEHATAVLINPRNHKLNGRQLVVEYASPDAVRRGGHREKGEGRPKGPKNFTNSKPVGRKYTEGGEEDSEQVHGDDNGQGDKGGDGSFASRKNERGSKDGYSKRRPKPGAALALAKRENVAIVPSEGTRITF